MKLYGYWRSSSAWRVRIALALKGLQYEYVAIDLIRNGGDQHADEFREKSPLAQVPLLEVEHDGKLVRLAQSMAIIEYLDETHPEPPLLPRDPVSRARARQLAETVNAGIQPAQNLYVLNYLKEHHPEAKRSDWAKHFIGRGLTAMEAIAKDTAGRFLVGDQVTIADVLLVPQLYVAQRFGVDLEPFPTLTRVDSTCEAIDAFARAHPDRQPDAPPPP
jgi:maleylpyruvate isomerase